MNLRQIQYAVQLARIRNFSQVAEMMEISQPALSKQIMNLEKELNIKLFDRNSIPLTLTEAGEFFIREAQELLDKEQHLLQSVAHYQSGQVQPLTIGVSPFRCQYLLPRAIKKLLQLHPEVQVTVVETGSDQLRKEAAEGKYDLAIVNLPVDESLLEVTPLEPDQLMLAVPKEYAGNLPKQEGNSYPKVDFALCRDIPFVVVSRGQELRRLCENLCSSGGFRPHIAMEVVGVSSAWAMVEAGIGATLVPLQFIRERAKGSDVCLYAIRTTRYTRQPVIVHRRGATENAYIKDAIGLLTQTEE